MKRQRLWAAVRVLLVVLLALQLVPVERKNPPVTQDVNAPAEMAGLLRRACYDCHSNEVRWPWYAYVAPISFLVARDVKVGRKHLNFSEWDALDPEQQARKLRRSGKEIEQNTMPLPIYRPLHPEAELSPEEKEKLVKWLRSGRRGRPKQSDP